MPINTIPPPHIRTPAADVNGRRQRLIHDRYQWRYLYNVLLSVAPSLQRSYAGGAAFTPLGRQWRHLQTSRLDGQAEDGHYAVHGLVLPADGAAAVSAVVPVARAGCVETGASLLHDDARYWRSTEGC